MKGIPNRPRPNPGRWSGPPRRPWYSVTGEVGELVETGFRHLRVAVVLGLLPVILLYPPAGSGWEPITTRIVAACALLGAIAMVNSLTLLSRRLAGGWIRSVASLSALAADAALALAISERLSSGSSDQQVLLLVIPLLEAGMRFGILGAEVAWLLLLGAGTLLDQSNAGTGFVESVAARSQPLGIALVIAIPGIYLAHRLVGAIGSEREMTAEVTGRSRLLETVARSAQRIGRLDAGMIEEVLESALLLGLDSADVCLRRSDGSWHVEAARRRDSTPALPDPDGPLGVISPTMPTRIIRFLWGEFDGTDRLLASCGLGGVIMCPLGAGEDPSVYLRGGVAPGGLIDNALTDSFELLAGNATIALQNRRLVGELRAMQAELHQQAYSDSLTGLANRSHFVDELERRIRVRSAGGERCAVIFIDLDRFKPVNDSLGHAAGNELLVEVGRRLEALIGPSDMAARIGGDEFVILVDTVRPDDPDEQLGAMADAICGVISRPIPLAANEVAVSCSVGVAVSRPGDGGAELLRRADLAMYRAKRHGKAQWVNYRADIDEEVVDRLQLENDLRKALQADTVDVHYQGILDLSDGSLVAVESLVRWNHPVRGPQQPHVLLPIAEDSGLILDLGDRVLDRTFEQGAVWQSQYGEAAPLVAVNVSPRQLIHPRFFPSLDNVMARTRIDPSKVILEVTENLVGWGEDVEALLEQVKDRGLRLALDDFGAGQTSLRHLRRFPIDILKIDKEFIQRGDRQHHDRAILSSIIDMAHQLDLIVIAEGVENRPQLEMLAQLGCDLVQGYLLHEPCEPGRLTSLLTGQSARRPPSSPADAQDSVTWGAGLH